MCGIVGMVGKVGVTDLALTALARLEYRGYDSYGVAALRDDGFEVVKQVGSIGGALRHGRFSALAPANLVVSHSRWATHGAVTERNAHPHLSYDGSVALVHNGVILNHRDLRRQLTDSGVVFSSETDSEVLAHLIARGLEETDDPVLAIRRAIAMVDGEYAISAAIVSHPDAIFGAVNKSPLMAAFDGSQAMLASDQAATAAISDRVAYLEDGDIVQLSVDSLEIREPGSGSQNVPVARPTRTVGRGEQEHGKGRYSHYMLKEIHEIPQAIQAALWMPSAALRGIVPAQHTLHLVGSGSAFYVTCIARYLFAQFANVAVSPHPSDEARALMCLREGDAVLSVSQSGETFDTLEAVRHARSCGVKTISLTNAPHSTMERIAERKLRQNAGREVCVLSTKSVISQVAILARVALEAGASNGALSPAAYDRHLASLAHLPATVEELVSRSSPTIQHLAEKISQIEHWFFLGRGALYPVALEGALKFKEVSYHHAEGIAGGFLKHGTISLVDPGFYTVALLPSPTVDLEEFQATLSNVSEIAARQGPVIGIGPSEVQPDDRQDFREYVSLPYHGECVADIVLQLVAGQLLAYYCALDLGRDIDQPRALAKAVTVR